MSASPLQDPNHQQTQQSGLPNAHDPNATATPPPQTTQLQQLQNAALQPPGIPHVIPPHQLMSQLGVLPPYQYGQPTDYTTAGLPQPGQLPSIQDLDSQKDGAGGRALSSSKRAEQNRKAQRAFRERRDQHVKALESRSQLLDAALASADEANRRWEECRTLVDQLRVENAALRAALQQQQQSLGQDSKGVDGSKPDE